MNLRFSIMNIMVLLSPIFLLGIYYFRSLPYLQLEVIGVAVITYLSLAILHHLKDRSIHLDLILEYVFVAILILVLVTNLSL